MPTHRFNRNVIGPIFSVTMALSAVGGVGYGGYSLLTASDSPETAEKRTQSNAMRLEIATYLPLTREMVIAAPPAEYPDSPEGSLNHTYEKAEEIAGNTRMGDLKLRCEVLAYLRAVHRRATENYLASDPALPLPNLKTHIYAAQRNVPAAPVCQP